MRKELWFFAKRDLWTHVPTGYLNHLESSKVGRQVVLLEGGWVKGDGVGQVDLPAFDLWHHVHQVQYLVRPFVSVGSVSFSTFKWNLMLMWNLLAIAWPPCAKVLVLEIQPVILRADVVHHILLRGIIIITNNISIVPTSRKMRSVQISDLSSEPPSAAVTISRPNLPTRDIRVGWRTFSCISCWRCCW